MSMFSKGDRVEWLGCWLEGRLGVLITGAVSDDPHTTVLVNWDNGGQETVKIGALRKVEPEFVVGQQVSGSDYERLPIGTEVQIEPYEAGFIKTRKGWLLGGDPRHPMSVHDRSMTHTIAALPVPVDRLPEHAHPEDADDVEPEPLKEGDRAFNDDDVQHLKVTAGSTVIFDGLAVFEEADNGNVIVTPVPRCTSLFNRPKTSEIVRCGQHEGHSHGHWTVGSHPATSWGDAMQYGRLVESDGAS